MTDWTDGKSCLPAKDTRWMSAWKRIASEKPEDARGKGIGPALVKGFIIIYYGTQEYLILKSTITAKSGADVRCRCRCKCRWSDPGNQIQTRRMQQGKAGRYCMYHVSSREPSSCSPVQMLFRSSKCESSSSLPDPHTR